ncbi:hypothetical protein HRbin16_00165 [bacterium HR16]|nr:hypothetical protein HRbin16_00165 [bacterium HR16]
MTKTINHIIPRSRWRAQVDVTLFILRKHYRPHNGSAGASPSNLFNLTLPVIK